MVETSYNSKISIHLNNVVYFLACIRCGIQYGRKTKRQLKFRLNELKSAIHQTDPKSAVARHGGLSSAVWRW